MGNMRLIICLIALAVLPMFSRADTNQLSSEDQQALLVATNFHAISFVTNLPPAVRKLIGPMAEKGQKWESTDVIEDTSLFNQRLIWAFTDGRYYVVLYERGGRGHSYYTQMVKLNEGIIQSSYKWDGGSKNYHGFLKELQDGTLTPADK